ncbi:hypothetical protein RhiTH_001625 [Rhizoctonia solani]
MNAPNCSPHTAVKEWEEAGASLLAAFKKYADMCTGIVKLPTDGGSVEDLAPRIESILHTVHATISEGLPKATAILTRLQNKLASSISHSPEEIMVEIFTNFIFDDGGPDLFTIRPMDQRVWLIYDRLHTLRGVCSAWRDIIMDRGSLWSVIPMIRTRSHGEIAPYEFSLQRAGKGTLHLAAFHRCFVFWERDFTKLISEYGPQLRTINIILNNTHLETVRETVCTLLDHDLTGSLSEFSVALEELRFKHREDSDYHDWDYTVPEFPREFDYLFPCDSPQHTSFALLLNSLVVFRIKNVLLHWEHISFSSRLTELHIQSIKLGYDDAIVPFVQTLSSAPELRVLKVIEVETFRNISKSPKVSALIPVELPKLQTLILYNLYFNTFNIVLRMIAPGKHRLSLGLDSASFETNQPPGVAADDFSNSHISGDEDMDVDGGDNPINISELLNALGTTHVDKLRLEAPINTIRTLLRGLQALLTLELNRWIIDESIPEWSATKLDRYHDHDASPDFPHHLLPELESLHLTCLSIGNHSIQPFQKMVASYPLKRIGIEGNLWRASDNEYSEGATTSCESIGEDTGLVQWLKDNVPNVFVGRYDQAYNARWDTWQL